MSYLRSLISIIFCLIITSIGYAQISFTTKTSATKIGKNEMLEVNYELENGTIENFTNPSFSEWQVVGGPNISSSTFITNGQKTTSMSYQFILKPLSPGIHNIPGAKALVEGKQVTSNPVAITVTSKNSPVNNSPPGGGNVIDPLLTMPPEIPSMEDVYESNDGYFLKDGEDILAKTKNNLFILVDVSKKTCYPGEALKAVYQLYSRVNLDAHISKRPSFNGFSSIDLPDATDSEYEIVKRSGKTFKVYPIRSVQLYPLLTGTQTLQPVEIETTVQYKRIPSEKTILSYNPYASSNIINYPYTVKCDSVTVNVLPFPDSGKPADFNGVTGHYDIYASCDQQELARSEAGTLRLEITGSGNWAMVQTPVIKWPEGVDVFEPLITESLDSQAVPVTGKRIYEFPFSTGKPGNLVIPAISIHFFDPVKKQYESNSTKPLTVKILNTSLPVNKTPESDYGGLSGTDNTQIFTDIVMIAFPIAAAMLVLILLMKNRRRRVHNRQAALYKVQYEARPKESRENISVKKNPVIPSSDPVSQFEPVANSSNAHARNALYKDEIIIEKTTLVNEQAGYPFTTQKSYFTVVKKDLELLLRKHFNLTDQPLPITRGSLLEHGFSLEETDKVINMLELCERHIYSPLAEDFDQSYCNQMVSEITSIINSKK